MMITSATAFADYFASVRRRTLTYARAVPPDQLDWAPRESEFSCGDILRHLIAAEAMFVGVAATGIWRYQGHTAHDDDTLAGLLARLEQGHAEALTTLRALPDAALQEQRPSLDGPSLRAWRWLMALAEHEIHHRSQLAMYLTLLGVTPPHIFGLGVEDVIARATG
ncbi:MAG: DinB family protein [Chloroflexales bacterium]|nr:DinB family protein [Chloroflexales bacterium]